MNNKLRIETKQFVDEIAPCYAILEGTSNHSPSTKRKKIPYIFTCLRLEAGPSLS